MRYQKPIYECTVVDAKDVVLCSVTVDPLTGVVLEETSGDSASIFTSIKNLFKFSE